MSRRSLAEVRRPFRIAHVITRLINGGADENTVLSSNSAVRAGHDVTIVHGAHTAAEILARVDPRVATIAMPSLVPEVAPFNDLRAFRELVNVFRRLRPDIVHTHTSKAGILGRVAARSSGVPVVVHGVHSTVPFAGYGRLETLIYLRAEKAVEGLTHAFIDVGSGVRDLCVNAGIGTAERHHVISSGFELEQFRNATPPEGWRELLRLRADEPRPPVLLMLARLEPPKRHLELLDAFPKVVARFPDVRLILAGDGPLRSSIETRVAALRLERNVILTGFYPQPEQLIALADICLFASVREAMSRVIVQYIAGGKPVVASHLPCLAEALRHDVNGLITPFEDLDFLADAVIALLEDEAERARLASGAAATDLSAWDAERMGERIDAVYAGLVAALRQDDSRSSRGSRAAAQSITE